MGNEMGNRNVNGLHASEQEGSEATTTVNESLKASIQWNDADGIKASEQDSTEATTTIDESSKGLTVSDADGLKSVINYLGDGLQVPEEASIVSSVSDGILGSDGLQASGHDVTENITFTQCSKDSDASNDANDLKLLKQPIPMVKVEDLKEMETRSAYNNPLETDDDVIQKQITKVGEKEETRTSSLSTSSRTDETVSILSVDLKHDEQETTTISNYESASEGTSEEQISNEDILVSDEKGHELPIKESEVSEGKELMINNLAEKNNSEENGEQQFPELDIVMNDSTPLQGENGLSAEPINSSYLEAIDSEIKMLLMEDDKKAGLIYNPNMNCNKSDEVELKDELKMDDMEYFDSFDTQVTLINPSQEEKQKMDDGSGDSLFDLNFQIDDKEKIENEHEKDQDCNPSLIYNQYGKELDEPVEIVEMRTATSLTEILVVDDKHEDKMERLSDGSDSEPKLLGNIDIKGEMFSEFSSSLSDAVGSASKELVNDLNATGKITEERTEQSEGGLDGQFKEVPEATSLEEGAPQINSKELATPVSPHLGTSEINKNLNVSLDNFQESEDEKYLRDQINPALNQKMSQETEILNADCTELYVNSPTQSQKEEHEFITIGYAGVQVPSTDLGAFENNVRLATESEQENLNSEIADTTKASYNLEKSVAETEISALLPQKENSQQNPLPQSIKTVKCLINAFERIGSEAQENSARDTTALEMRTEESEQNPLLQEKTDTNQEVPTKVGSETELSVLESNNEECDRSPLLYQKKAGESALEGSDSGKLRIPLQSLLKEELYVLESSEKQEGLVLEKTVEEVWNSPAKKKIATSPRGRVKQKPRSSLFSNCMCCTTVMN